MRPTGYRDLESAAPEIRQIILYVSETLYMNRCLMSGRQMSAGTFFDNSADGNSAKTELPGLERRRAAVRLLVTVGNQPRNCSVG